jgi:hypothetical protein
MGFTLCEARKAQASCQTLPSLLFPSIDFRELCGIRGKEGLPVQLDPQFRAHKFQVKFQQV